MWTLTSQCTISPPPSSYDLVEEEYFFNLKAHRPSDKPIYWPDKFNCYFLTETWKIKRQPPRLKALKSKVCILLYLCTGFRQSSTKVLGQTKQNKQRGDHHPPVCSPLPCSMLQHPKVFWNFNIDTGSGVCPTYFCRGLSEACTKV